MYQSRLGSSLDDLDCWNHSCYIEYKYIRKDHQTPRYRGVKTKVEHLIRRVVDDEVHAV